jgi:GAF domain-containing protein
VEHPDTELDLTARMVAVAGLLRSNSNGVDTLAHAVTKTAVDCIPGTECAGVIALKGQQGEPMAANGVAVRADQLQQELHEGPAVRPKSERSTVWIDDLDADDRWPRFAAGAQSLGIRSMASLRLFAGKDDLGTLNLYSSKTRAFDERARTLGEVFAAHTAVAFSALRERENLEVAISSRDLIGQAKGMVMERYGIDADEAFRLLARLSQESNTKVAEIARQVVEAGSEPV